MTLPSALRLCEQGKAFIGRVLIGLSDTFDLFGRAAAEM